MTSLTNFMNYDLIINNPPYSVRGKTGKKTNPIWDKFVEFAFKHCKENGYICMVHPSGWRNVEGRFKYIKDILLKKDIKYLELHTKEDGIKTFGAATTYDWYVVKNTKKENPKPTVKFQDNKIVKNFDLNKYPIIPNNSNFELYDKVFAKDVEEKVNILYSSSMYEVRNDHMFKQKTSKFKYPCIYYIDKKENINIHYSSIKKGHFGISKFICGPGDPQSTGFSVDEKGEYGMTQFAFGIIDYIKNLHKIKKAFSSDKFRIFIRELMNGRTAIDYKLIKLFKKDFWKEFI